MKLDKNLVIQLFSILVFVLVYGHSMGYPVALAIVATIGWHEYCHILMARKLGYQADNFYLIPFMGGIAPIEQQRTEADSVKISLAGPVFGSILGFLFFGAALIFNVPFLYKAAFFNFMVNAFNLLPLSFLDGGRVLDSICKSTNKTFEFVAKTITTICVVLLTIFVIKSLVMALVMIYALYTYFKLVINFYKFKRYDVDLYDYTYDLIKLSKKEIVLSAFSLVGFFAFLCFIMSLFEGKIDL